MTTRMILSTTITLLLTVALAHSDGSMHCGNSFVKLGERAFLVQQDCGEPVSKQHIGYTIDPKERRELLIEEWVYGPRDGGYFYIITFVGGKVTQITSER